MKVTWLLNVATVLLVSCIQHVNGYTGCPSDLPDTSEVTQYRGKCYQFVHKEKYWTDARDYCWKYGGGLVMIPNQDINDYVISVISGLSTWKNNGIWIGLNDKRNELVWKWVTNTEFNFIPLNTSWTNWAKGHPEGVLHSARDCIRMIRKENWKWSETPCSTFLWKYRFICQYDYVAPTTTPAQPEPNLGFMVGEKQPGMPSGGGLTTNIVYTHLKSSTVTSPQASKTEAMHDQNAMDTDSSFAAVSRERKEKNTQLAVILGTLGATGFLVILVIIIIIKRRRSKEHTEEASIDNPSYNVPSTKVKGLDTMSKDKASGHSCSSRRDNLYVTNNNTPMDNSDQHDGYLAPKSLMHAGQITDSYLTTAEAKSESLRPVMKPGEAKHEPQMFIHCEAEKENLCNSGYLPMNGSNEKINNPGSRSTSASLSGLRSCGNVEDDYELPTSEPIYAEIPEIKPREVAENGKKCSE